MYVFTLLKNRGRSKSYIRAAINSLGKAAIGGSERTEVRSYIKRLESEIKSSHQILVKVVWPN